MKQQLFSIASLLFLHFAIPSVYGQNLKVFILAGQSNMQGHGDVQPATSSGTLAYTIANDPTGEFNHLQTNGNWSTRNDVWVRYDHDNGNLLTGDLGVGFGGYSGQIGPELEFGHLLGDYCQDQVLVIKTCWGGTNLAVDFRPPSSGGTVGPYYNQMISDINSSINNLSVEFPQYAGEPVEIAGFCWFQGWNDGENTTYLDEYEQNLKNLVSDVRDDLNSPNLPFVIGLTGNGGYNLFPGDMWIQGLQTTLVPAQISAAEYSGHSYVSYAETRGFWKDETVSPYDAAHHWNNNAESYLRIGREMGLEMIALLDELTLSNIEADHQKVLLYPCPATDYIQLQGINIAQVSVRSLNGKLVSSHENVLPYEHIDISSMAKGTYFVEVRDNPTSLVKVFKLVHQ